MSAKTDEEKYQEEIKAAGVDLPELQETETKVEEAPEEKVEDTTPEPTLKTQPTEQKPRSIYDEYKEKKAEVRTERELREQVERERDELRAKLDAATQNQGEDQGAEEDAIAYAKKIGADPDLVQRIIADARKGVEVDPTLKQDLEEFKAFKAANAKAIEAQRFDEEFKSIVPSLKQQYPFATAEELDAIKKELDGISHTKEWHTYSLDYVAFKNAEKLKELVSPKKRGMESKGRQDTPELSNDFDPNADYSKMTMQEREAWEAKYRAMTKTDGLIDGARGKLII